MSEINWLSIYNITLTTCLQWGCLFEGLKEARQCLVSGSNTTLVQDPSSTGSLCGINFSDFFSQNTAPSSVPANIPSHLKFNIYDIIDSLSFNMKDMHGFCCHTSNNYVTCHITYITYPKFDTLEWGIWHSDVMGHRLCSCFILVTLEEVLRMSNTVTDPFCIPQ